MNDLTDSYTSEKASDILTFRYKCSQCKSLAKRPRKNESMIEYQLRDLIAMDYKLILHEAIEALRIVKEQENIGNK
ncbi:hypothetical protein RhiirA5_429524 [Rhizophagus irregularis]|uniref:Uncharacterized protein n=1 Tax=Rhizophagus irregularis TaxID=588596 RepID=A0A2N0NY99_9GLOM|nr:hypothetical protein RhiirA5_429524 [Rhizophagus irregularis]PKC65482.1 hypothetical protein RhiirA1_460975 [Rhizophagus irregularis]